MLFKVAVSLLEAAKPMRVRAALSRDGIEVYGDSVMMNPKEQQEILLQVTFLFVFLKFLKYFMNIPLNVYTILS